MSYTGYTYECDQCRAQPQAKPAQPQAEPAAWYRLTIPFSTVPRHFCSGTCLSKWASRPIRLGPELWEELTKEAFGDA